MFDSLLVAIDDLGRHAPDEEAYYRGLLLLLVGEGPFATAAVWSVDASAASLRACAPADFTPPAIPDSSRARLVTRQAFELPGGGSSNGSSSSGTRRLLAGVRIHLDEGVALDTTSKGQVPADRLMRLVEAVAELVAHAETRFRYVAARSRLAAWVDIERIVRSFHQGRSLEETGLLIAAGFQEGLGYDRCWTCIASGGRARVIASHVPGDVARRQWLVGRVETLASEALAGGEEISWVPDRPEAAGGRSAIDLAEESSARRILAFPLLPSGSTMAVGVVVLEQFSNEIPLEEPVRRQILTPHATQALARAVEVERRTWPGRLRDGGAWRRRGAAALIALAATVFLAMPVSFDVEAEGRLLPAAIRSVFAPADGIVAAIHVRHGQSVEAGASLLDLRSADLELERERVAGQISELTAKLAAIQVLRTQGRDRGGDSEGELSAQEEQYQAALRGAERQRGLIDEQMQELALRSPIAGVVDRWDLGEALESRPVVRGQHLCDVLDVAGRWKLELHVPDRLAGVVFAAREKRPDLPVRYVLRTDAQTEHSTRLSSLGERTEVDEGGQLVVRATALLDGDQAGTRRPGASVLARIGCGRRARAFVWFREIWEFLALQWL